MTKINFTSLALCAAMLSFGFADKDRTYSDAFEMKEAIENGNIDNLYHVGVCPLDPNVGIYEFHFNNQDDVKITLNTDNKPECLDDITFRGKDDFKYAEYNLHTDYIIPKVFNESVKYIKTPQLNVDIIRGNDKTPLFKLTYVFYTKKSGYLLVDFPYDGIKKLGLSIKKLIKMSQKILDILFAKLKIEKSNITQKEYEYCCNEMKNWLVYSNAVIPEKEYNSQKQGNYIETSSNSSNNVKSSNNSPKNVIKKITPFDNNSIISNLRSETHTGYEIKERILGNGATVIKAKIFQGEPKIVFCELKQKNGNGFNYTSAYYDGEKWIALTLPSPESIFNDVNSTKDLNTQYNKRVDYVRDESSYITQHIAYVYNSYIKR